ncbi:MAG: stalk domain-containing protein [bacterium]|nr:stalk domain-containing protein [bacterium]
MKSKKITGIIITAALAAGTAAASANNSNDITVKINGTSVDFSKYDGVTPYIENSTTLIPVRAIAEGLNCEVSWDAEAQTVSIKGIKEITLTINSAAAIVDNESIQLDMPAQIVSDRTFVPLRFISENLGAKVDWNEETQLITIETYKENGENMQNGGKWKGITVGTKGDRQPKIETDPDIIEVISAGADKFTQAVFEDTESNISLEYSLYVPYDYDDSEKYPLIMYIPDASGASKSAKEIVEQYYGANIWVTDEEQAKHKSFVLVPAFSEIVVDDDWNTSQEIETAVKLINSITEQYSIDTNRLYTTGQSMGCMTSLYLNGKYPDLFAASLFVSGQWDIEQLQPLTDKKFFYITAGGDANACGGQDSVKAMLEASEIGYSFGEWNAQNSEEEQNTAAQELISEGNNANMIRFEVGSVLTDGSGMEHNASFNYGYKIPAVRDWLFEQSKDNL